MGQPAILERFNFGTIYRPGASPAMRWLAMGGDFSCGFTDGRPQILGLFSFGLFFWLSHLMLLKSSQVVGATKTTVSSWWPWSGAPATRFWTRLVRGRGEQRYFKLQHVHDHITPQPSSQPRNQPHHEIALTILYKWAASHDSTPTPRGHDFWTVSTNLGGWRGRRVNSCGGVDPSGLLLGLVLCSLDWVPALLRGPQNISKIQQNISKCPPQNG